MKRLLSAISVLCILFLIVQTSREYQERPAYAYDYEKMMPLTGKPEAGGLECIRSLYRMRAEREEMGDWYFYSSYAKEIYDDYDRNGSKEAFVAIGQKTGDTEEYLFGNLYFVSDLGIQPLEEAVFIGKEPICNEKNGKTHISFAYKEDVQPMQAVYTVTGGLAERQNPIERKWEEKAVAGNEFTPDTDLLERLANAKDFREDEYIYADIEYTSNYMITPKWKEADFDRDGVNELAMITYVKHGTGLWVESLYIADQNETGEWEMYEFLHEDYCQQLRKHFDTVTDGDDIWFVFDGKWIGAPELFNQGDSYRYDVENQIEFEFTSDGIEIIAEVEGICTSGGWGINDYPDYYISAQVKHLENGNWQLSDVRCRTSE